MIPKKSDLRSIISQNNNKKYFTYNIFYQNLVKFAPIITNDNQAEFFQGERNQVRVKNGSTANRWPTRKLGAQLVFSISKSPSLREKERPAISVRLSSTGQLSPPLYVLKFRYFLPTILSLCLSLVSLFLLSSLRRLCLDWILTLGR